MKYWFISAVLAVSLLPAFVWSLDPKSMPEAEKQAVVSQCHDIRRNLQSIKHIDTLTRVNRGTATTNLVTLMSAFNSRAASNTFNIPPLVTATKNVQDLRREFGDDYTLYETALRDLIAIDCTTEPVAFYEQLVEVRAKRTLLNTTIKEIESQLDIFQTNTDEVLTKIKDR